MNTTNELNDLPIESSPKVTNQREYIKVQVFTQNHDGKSDSFRSFQMSNIKINEETGKAESKHDD